MVKEIVRGTIALAGIGISVYEGVAAGKITKRALDKLVESDGVKDEVTKAGICGVVGTEVANLGLTGTILLLKAIK